MKDLDLIPVSVRISKKDYEQYKRLYSKTFSDFVRASVKVVLTDGRESFEKIYFDKTLKSEVF